MELQNEPFGILLCSFVAVDGFSRESSFHCPFWLRLDCDVVAEVEDLSAEFSLLIDAVSICLVERDVSVNSISHALTDTRSNW